MVIDMPRGWHFILTINKREEKAIIHKKSINNKRSIDIRKKIKLETSSFGLDSGEYDVLVTISACEEEEGESKTDKQRHGMHTVVM